MNSDLTRFHTAQAGSEGPAWDQAFSELQQGGKRSHWIWYVLPQLRGLGHSSLAHRYGLADLAEAKAYLEDPLLRQRLEQTIAVIAMQLNRPGMSLSRLMGGEIDAAKTISALTLFETAGLEAATPVLELLGRRCRRTLQRLKQEAADQG